MRHLPALFWLLLLFLSACGDKNEMPPVNDCGEDKSYRQGVFVLNEGNLSSGVGTVSFFQFADEQLDHNVFQNQNCDQELGSVAQSITRYLDHYYIVVHNSDIIHIVRADDFRLVGSIEGLELPRYFLPINEDKAYVSQWGEGLRDKASIAVVDLKSRQVQKTLPTGAGTEHMLREGNLVYAVNEGALLNDSLLLIVDTERDEIVDRIALPAFNPHSLQIDQNGDMWVLCRGFTDWNNNIQKDGALVRFREKEIQEVFPVPNFSRRLKINPSGDILYFILEQGGIARHPIDATSFDSTPFLNGRFYNIGIHPDDGDIYTTDYLDFSSDGRVDVFRADGVKYRSFQAGIGPSELLFVD
ncbi:MAG: DUF5074 domain-containing protein [Bacteroidota bacterium]